MRGSRTFVFKNKKQIHSFVLSWGEGGGVHLPRAWQGRKVLVTLLNDVKPLIIEITGKPGD